MDWFAINWFTRSEHVCRLFSSSSTRYFLNGTYVEHGNCFDDVSNYGIACCGVRVPSVCTHDCGGCCCILCVHATCSDITTFCRVWFRLFTHTGYCESRICAEYYWNIFSDTDDLFSLTSRMGNRFIGCSRTI